MIYDVEIYVIVFCDVIWFNLVRLMEVFFVL